MNKSAQGSDTLSLSLLWLPQCRLPKLSYNNNSGTTSVYCSEVFDNLIIIMTSQDITQDTTHWSNSTPAYGFTFVNV